MANIVPITNLRGPAARIVAVSAESVAAGVDAEVTMSGPDQGRTFSFKVPRGLPGASDVPTDPAMAEIISATDSETREAVDAAISENVGTPTLVSRAHTLPLSKMVAKPAKHLPSIVPLIASTMGDVLYRNSTGAVDSVLTLNGANTMKLTATGTPTFVSAYRTLTGGVNIGAVQTICAEVYIPNLSKVTAISLNLYHDAGLTTAKQWVVTNTTIGQPLVQGWNTLRIPAARLASQYSRANWIATWGTPHRVEVLVAGTFVAGDTVNIGRMYAEKQDRAKLMIINDAQYKTFFTQAYPLLKSRNYPVNLGVSVGDSWGSAVGTIHERITLEDWLPYTRENGNSTSFHSAQYPPPDGPIGTSNLTGPELREMNRIAEDWLRTLGATGRMWRCAWTQNLAPNAPATFDQMVACAMYDATKLDNGNFTSTPWPPVNQYNIRRDSPESSYGDLNAIKARIDYWFEEMRIAHTTQAIFIHGIDPTYAFSTPMAAWEYFVAQIDIAVAAGWLDVVTFEDLYYGSGGNFEIQPDGRAKSNWWTYAPVIID